MTTVLELADKSGYALNRVRCAPDGATVALYGHNGAAWVGIGDRLQTALRNTPAANAFTDVALLGADSAVLITDRNGYQAFGVPQQWIDDLAQINKEGLRIATVAATANADGSRSFAVQIDGNGYQFRNVSNAMQEAWRTINARKVSVSAFAMRPGGWLIVEAR